MQIFLAICVSSVYPMPRYRILIVSTCIVRLRKPFLMNRRTSFIYMCVCVRICSAKRDVSGRGDIRGENLFELYVKIGFSSLEIPRISSRSVSFDISNSADLYLLSNIIVLLRNALIIESFRRI